jgi:hypothetical protein
VDHQFAGFGTVTQTDAAGNMTKTYCDTSNGASTSTGQSLDDFWKIGKPYRVQQYDNAGNLYKATITKWDSASLGGIQELAEEVVAMTGITHTTGAAVEEALRTSP